MKYKYKISLSIIAFFLILGGFIMANYGIYMKSLSKEYIAVNDSKCINVIYSDDMDLCRKYREQEYKIIYNPTVEIIHHKYKSSMESNNKKQSTSK